MLGDIHLAWWSQDTIRASSSKLLGLSQERLLGETQKQQDYLINLKSPTGTKLKFFCQNH